MRHCATVYVGNRDRYGEVPVQLLIPGADVKVGVGGLCVPLPSHTHGLVLEDGPPMLCEDAQEPHGQAHGVAHKRQCCSGSKPLHHTTSLAFGSKASGQGTILCHDGEVSCAARAGQPEGSLVEVGCVGTEA